MFISFVYARLIRFLYSEYLLRAHTEHKKRYVCNGKRCVHCWPLQSFAIEIDRAYRVAFYCNYTYIEMLSVPFCIRFVAFLSQNSNSMQRPAVHTQTLRSITIWTSLLCIVFGQQHIEIPMCWPHIMHNIGFNAGIRLTVATIWLHSTFPVSFVVNFFFISVLCAVVSIYWPVENIHINLLESFYEIVAHLWYNELQIDLIDSTPSCYRYRLLPINTIFKENHYFMSRFCYCLK